MIAIMSAISCLWGGIAEQQGDQASAEKYYQRSVNLFPYNTDVTSYLELAGFYYRQKDFSRFKDVAEDFVGRYTFDEHFENYKHFYIISGSMGRMAELHELFSRAYREQGLLEQADEFQQIARRLAEERLGITSN